MNNINERWVGCGLILFKLLYFNINLIMYIYFYPIMSKINRKINLLSQ